MTIPGLFGFMSVPAAQLTVLLLGLCHLYAFAPIGHFRIGSDNLLPQAHGVMHGGPRRERVMEIRAVKFSTKK